MPRSMARHIIDDISYSAERRGWYGIRCTCGAEVTAELDTLEHDRHEPLCDAWDLHRRTPTEAPEYGMKPKVQPGAAFRRPFSPKATVGAK